MPTLNHSRFDLDQRQEPHPPPGRLVFAVVKTFIWGSAFVASLIASGLFVLVLSGAKSGMEETNAAALAGAFFVGVYVLARSSSFLADAVRQCVREDR